MKKNNCNFVFTSGHRPDRGVGWVDVAPGPAVLQPCFNHIDILKGQREEKIP